MKLDVYNAKRDFHRTGEPKGRLRKARAGRSFVVQEHAARRLHYDFRLELDGVLLSWAVPKGPSLSPKDRRLAVRVEDHPIDYRDFEGTIPAGEYGAGSVIVWDRGEWSPEGDPHEGLAKGRLDFRLDGEKLHGGFLLVRTRRAGGKEQWLLIKRRDDFADGAGFVARHPESVLTGRTLEDVAKGEAAELPRFGSIAPELATLVDDVPAGEGWVHEIKYDGYRILAWLDDGEVRLASRNGKEWTERFPAIAEALSHVRARSAVLDGEVAFVRDDGTTDFQALQNGEDPSRIVYFVFDLLHFDGVDRTKEPLGVRKDLLRTILAGERPPLRLGDHVSGDGRAFYREACKLGLEGIVSKREDAPYRPGKRGPDWVKVKCQKRQEMIIAGFTAPKGSRSGLGALLLAVREGTTLRYAGKVGTGFSQESLADLTKRLRPLAIEAPAVEGAPRAKDATWVRPKLVCEVRFTEWTADGMLRHPTFEGLREDKPARAVVRERASHELGSITITHPDRIIDPASGLTKADLARYHEATIERLLPYARKRPLMLLRCPEGQEKRTSCFVQKHSGRGLGDKIGRDRVGKEEVLFVTKPDEVFELVQFNVLELHGWGSRMPRWDRPDWIVFDLDPDEALPFARVAEAAKELRDALRSLGLVAFAKTTGGKGLHVVVPLAPRYDWDAVSGFAEAFARAFVAQAPDRYVATMSKAARRGKIFVDHFRNAKGATAVLPWSPRARDGLTVAVPVAWRDLAHVDPRELTIRTAPKLRGDPWRDLLATKQALPRIR